MRSFIPEEDRAVFEQFLEEHELVMKTKQTTPHTPPLPSIPPPPTSAPPPPPPPSMPPPPPPMAGLPQGQSPKQSDVQKRRKDRQQRNFDVDKFVHDIEADMNTVIDSTDF